MATKKHFSFDNRITVIIAIISLLMMVGVASLPFKAKPFGDITFHKEAKNMALWIKGGGSFQSVMITKAPGPVLFYTPAYMLAPASANDDRLWFYGVALTSILVTIALVLIFRSGALLFSRGVGLLAVTFFLIVPIHCYYSLGILAEAPAFFSLSLAIYGWAIAYRDPGRKSGWIYLTIGLWLLILNRPNSLLLPGFGFFVVAYSWLRSKEFYSAYGRKLLASFVATILLCFAVSAAAAAITKGKLKQEQGWLLYYVAHQGRFQFREEPLDFRFWDNTSRSDSKDYQNWNKSRTELQVQADKSGREVYDLYKQFLVADVIDHPWWFTRQFFVKCIYGHLYMINSVKPASFSLGPFKGATGYWAFIFLINSINLIIIVGAFIFLFHQNRFLPTWILWGIILSLLLFHGLTYMEPRYIFPSRVALYLMSAAGWSRFSIVRKMTDRILSWISSEKNPAIDH